MQIHKVERVIYTYLNINEMLGVPQGAVLKKFVFFILYIFITNIVKINILLTTQGVPQGAMMKRVIIKIILTNLDI